MNGKQGKKRLSHMKKFKISKHKAIQHFVSIKGHTLICCPHPRQSTSRLPRDNYSSYCPVPKADSPLPSQRPRQEAPRENQPESPR